ncbi:hypothetical protein PCE1_004478 [Barthelona sp. PCE]
MPPKRPKPGARKPPGKKPTKPKGNKPGARKPGQKPGQRPSQGEAQKNRQLAAIQAQVAARKAAKEEEERLLQEQQRAIEEAERLEKEREEEEAKKRQERKDAKKQKIQDLKAAGLYKTQRQLDAERAQQERAEGLMKKYGVSNAEELREKMAEERLEHRRRQEERKKQRELELKREQEEKLKVEETTTPEEVPEEIESEEDLDWEAAAENVESGKEDWEDEEESWEDDADNWEEEAKLENFVDEEDWEAELETLEEEEKAAAAEKPKEEVIEEEPEEVVAEEEEEEDALPEDWRPITDKQYKVLCKKKGQKGRRERQRYDRQLKKFNELHPNWEEELAEAERQKELQKIGHRRKTRADRAERLSIQNDFRAPIVTILGHVDTGKTSILDFIRSTHVQADEAGGITQQIGASFFPVEKVIEIADELPVTRNHTYKLPGVLVIDTPGHESFSNLRSRGSNMANFAILVIDIMHGLEPQTIESINLLRSGRVPFVIALNKIDRLSQWKEHKDMTFEKTFEKQSQHTRNHFTERLHDVIAQLSDQGIFANVYTEISDPRKEVSLVPTSAWTGEGLGDLMHCIMEFSERFLGPKLRFIDDVDCTVLEVKVLPGVGCVLDCVLANGTINRGDTIIMAGLNGVVTTKVRELMTPKPLKEMRTNAGTGAYVLHQSLQGSSGVRIQCADVTEALAGSPIFVAVKDDEYDYCVELAKKEVSDVLAGARAEQGVHLQASTLGALEALIKYLHDYTDIPIASAAIGPVRKMDVMSGMIMHDTNSEYACVLAFNVKVDSAVEEYAAEANVKIFTAEIIYHLHDDYYEWRTNYRKRVEEEALAKGNAVWPGVATIVPGCVFNSRNPIVVGLEVRRGRLHVGAPLSIQRRGFRFLAGRIESIEVNHAEVQHINKGEQGSVKIKPIVGEPIHQIGRDIQLNDAFVTNITKAGVTALLAGFKHELTEDDLSFLDDLKDYCEFGE